MPPEVERLFWGDNLKELSWQKHKKYIIQTILDKGNEKAVNWLFQRVEKSEIKSQLNHYLLSPKSRNFWEIWL